MKANRFFKKKKHSPDKKTLVGFTPYRKLPNGTILYAKDYGYKAWPIYR